MSEPTNDPAVSWPNQEPVLDGVVPVDEVSQDPDLQEIDSIDDSDLTLEMED
jgi:hypothetical protein